MILLHLAGAPADVESFIKRLKTETVDVDSRGRPCKVRVVELGVVLPAGAPAHRASLSQERMSQVQEDREVTAASCAYEFGDCFSTVQEEVD